MKNGVLRAIRFYMHISWNTWRQTLLLCAFYVLCSLFMEAGNSFIMLGVVFLMAMPLFESVGAFSGSYKYTVGFSLSRKNLFLGGIVAKIAYAVLATAIAFGAAMIFTEVPLRTPLSLLCFFLGTIFMGAFGDLEGFILLKFPKRGFIIYMITTLLLVFAIMIGMIVLSLHNTDFIVTLLNDFRTVIVLLGGIAALLVINRLTSKSLEVRA